MMARYNGAKKTHLDDKMKVIPEYELSVNALKYKKSLDRIIEKYSKLQHQEDAIEVDLNNIKPKALENYLNKTKTLLDQMESQSVTDMSDESLRAHDCTGDPQLDFWHRDDDLGDSSVSVEEDEGVITVDTSQSSQWSDSMVGFQPEDQNEELELSLRGNGSLVELYPSMISRLEQARHRHCVFEAADSVLRRYRKWRQQPHKSRLNCTFDVTLTHRRPKPKAGASVSVDIQPPLQSPWRGRSPQRRAQQGPALVMDLSDSSHVFKPTICRLDQTVNVPVQEEPSWSCCVSPPRRRLSLPRVDGAGVRSPSARHSPFNTRRLSSPQSFSWSPRACSPQGPSRELRRPRVVSASSSPHGPAAAMMVPLPQDSRQSQSQFQFQSRPHSVQSGHHRLRRHLSFDSSLPLGRASYSTRDLDEDFIKLYHQVVCQSKSSFFSSLPCRYCARNPEANRSRSSSSLAALALSPHRSLLRKRAGEESPYGSLGSKRSRVESHASSPGSKRHVAEVLRRRLSLAEPAQPRERACCSPSKRSFLPSCSHWSPSAERPERAWARYQAAAEPPSLGFSLERKMATGRSLRW